MKERESMLDKNNMTLSLEKMTEKSIAKNQISRDALSKKKSLQEKGITLIALVVTIIILLILAGVTLNIALSENGLFSKTKDAADKYKQAQSDEEDMVTKIEEQLEGYTSNNPSPSTPTVTPKEIPLVTTFTEFTTENKEAKDSLGNLITIPKGFKFAENNGDTVKNGIIIEDNNQNQFVWIPVSNIDGDNNATTEPNSEDLITIDGDSKIEITLGRYTFNTSNGDSTLVQSGSKYDKDSENGKDFTIDGKYDENTTDPRTNGGVGAKDLQGFVDSVQKNHGYYIARYEAGEGTDEKPISKAGVSVWNNVKQSEASAVAQSMYTDTGFTSDLVNSYAWDTAIVYIQSMGDANYAKQGRTTLSLANTGSESNNDVKCNIYDMAGNVIEWTTEYSTSTLGDTNSPCVYRGGFFNGRNDTFYTAKRLSDKPTASDGGLGFRPLLYLK